MINKTLAVIMPCWNSMAYIGQLLDCFLKQSFSSWTLFAVDDGSTDDTISIIKQYERKDSRIHLVQRESLPKGAQTCRNYGVSLTNGYKYIIIIDSDDLLADYCFEQRVSYMEKHPEIDFAVFPAKKFIKEPLDNYHKVYGIKCFPDTLEAMFYKTLPMVGWTNIYRRESYIKYGLVWDQNLKSMQDSDFNIQAILKGCKFDFAEDALPDYFYRELNNSVSKHQVKTSHFKSHAYLMNKVVNSLSKEQIQHYRLALNSYMLLFFYIAREKESRKVFFNNSFLCDKWWFKTRLLLLSFMHKRYRFVLFPMVSIRMRKRQYLWYKYMEEKSIYYLSRMKKN